MNFESCYGQYKIQKLSNSRSLYGSVPILARSFPIFSYSPNLFIKYWFYVIQTHLKVVRVPQTFFRETLRLELYVYVTNYFFT